MTGKMGSGLGHSTSRSCNQRNPRSRRRRSIAGAARYVVEALEQRTLLNAVYLDPTFGTNGFTSINFPGSTNDVGSAITVSQPDGKILLAGQQYENAGIEVARLNPEGNLDTTFGNGGHVLLHYGTICRADSIVEQPDGKILVGGVFNGEPGQFSPDGSAINGHIGVVRLDPDGSLDTTFGNAGLAQSNQVFPSDRQMNHLVLQPDGDIVLAGAVFNNYRDFALTRFTPDGLLDNTFGSSGVATVDFGWVAVPTDLTTDASGNLVVAGLALSTVNSAERDIGVARLSPDGVLDQSFGNGGTVVVQPLAPYTGFSGENSVVVDSAGRIILGGGAFSNASNWDFSLVRLTSAGAIDPSFGSAGRVTTDVCGNGGFDAIAGLTLQPDGKIIAAGNSASFLAVVRYNTDGSLDTSFNSTGMFALNQPGDTTFANGAFGVGAAQFGPAIAVALQTDGSIVTNGVWQPGDGTQDFLVTRLMDQSPTIDYSGGFANTGQLTLNGAAAINGSALQLSGGAASTFSTMPRDITEFNTQFTFKGGAAGDNFSFVVRADGPTALTGGLDRSLAVNFELDSEDIRTSVSVNGDKDMPGHVGFGFNANDTYSATLNYVFFNGGSILRMKVADLTSGAVSSVSDNNWGQIDIPALMANGAAYVGFTSGGAAPDILSWSFIAPSLGATPFAPSLVRPKSSPNQITLTWTDNSSNEDGFDIEKCDGPGLQFEHLAYVPANTTSYTDTIDAADMGRILLYRVRAFNSAGWSLSMPVQGAATIVPPPAPTNATVINVLPNAVDMIWQDNSGLISPYRIYRRVGGTGDFSLYAVVHQGISEYVDNRAPSGTLLEYRIVAFGDVNHANTEAQEAESAPAYVTVTTPPAAVDQFGPQIVTNGSAHLAGGALVLTDNQPVVETGSAWGKDYQYTSQFTTQFSFRFANADPGGMTFEIQEANPTIFDGHHALGDNSDFGFGGTVGAYSIVGLKFYLGGPGGSGGGATGIDGGSFFQPNFNNVTSAGINFSSGHVFNVTLSYGRFILKETITDATTNATFTHTYWVHDLIGNGYQLVGFSASKPAGSQQIINVTSWGYSGGGNSTPATLLNNHAPVLSGANDFPPRTEDDVNNSSAADGQTVAQLTAGHVTDPDGPTLGMAVTGTTGANGRWQYFGFFGWTDIGPVSDSSALLLHSDSPLRFLPDGKNGGIATVTFRAWDGSDGITWSQGSPKVDASVNGDSTSFSAQTATAQLTVTDVNDAPVLTGANSFPAITEDDVNNLGQSVAQLIAGYVSDPDLNALPAGIAVYQVSTNTAQNPYSYAGTWQYSLDGGASWTNFPADLSQDSATLLSPDARVRDLPNGEYGTASTAIGVPDFVTFAAWDRSDGRASGTTGIDLFKIIWPNGQSNPRDVTAPFNGSATVPLSIADVNDAPLLSGANDFPTTIANDPNGSVMSTDQLRSGRVTDPDAVASGAAFTDTLSHHFLAVTGQDPGNGTWQYFNAFTSQWTDMGAVSDQSALQLGGGTPLRFLPDGTHGTSASITYRAWDGSNKLTPFTYADASVNGGTSAYSAQTATAHVIVLPIVVPTTLALASAGAVYGTTTTLSASLSANGSPVSNALITFTRVDGSVIGTAITDANGLAVLNNVSIGGLDFGTYSNAFAASFAGDARHAPSSGVTSLTVIDENLQGLVWVDFNNDGNVDFGEQGIGGVPISLIGSAGNVVATTTTDSNGLYTFNHVPPDVYSISEGGAPAGYVEGKDSLGTITDLQGNTVSTGAGSASLQDLFSNVPIGADQNAINYNFGEQPAAGSAVSKGQAATMGFWQNKNGQALINKFASIGAWLADTMPQTFGGLAGATPQQVATLYQQKFVLTDKLDAQVMATALNVYATDVSLGGSAAASYGFAVGTYGLGDSTWNIGSDGAAFNAANNSTWTVLQILQDWDEQANKTSKSIRQMALDIFGGINAKGGI